MKVEILKENLKNGLNIVEKIVGNNLSLPILNNVLIMFGHNMGVTCPWIPTVSLVDGVIIGVL